MATAHELFVEDDVVYFVARGEVTESDLRAVIQHGTGIAERRGGYWIVADVRGMRGMSPAARRWAAMNPRADLFRGAAIFGGSTVTRALITLVTRAMVLVGWAHMTLRFFDDHAAGRRWVREQLAREDAVMKAPER